MSSVKKQISIIVLTFNSEKWIKRCLTSITRNANRNEIIVIDNNSSDRTIETIRKYSPKIKIINNKKNLGFARGVNIGIKNTQGKYILLINPDSKTCPKAVENVVTCLTTNDADIAGAKLIRNNEVHGSFVRKPNLLTGIFDYTNLRKIIPGDYFHKKHYYLEQKFPKKTKEVDAISGAFMLIKRDVFKRIGYFDENFFMYLEDIDFCTRAKQAGFKIIFCPNAVVYHHGGASSTNKHRTNYQAWSDSRRYYFLKHFSVMSNIIIQPIFILDDLITTTWRAISQK